MAYVNKLNKKNKQFWKLIKHLSTLNWVNKLKKTIAPISAFGIIKNNQMR
jgi:hypothetical protein